MAWPYNPFTGTLDKTGVSLSSLISSLDDIYLKLDQTVPQTTIDVFIFPDGILAGSTTLFPSLGDGNTKITSNHIVSTASTDREMSGKFLTEATGSGVKTGVYGLLVDAIQNGSGLIGDFIGIAAYSDAYSSSSGNITNWIGVDVNLFNAGTSVINNVYGIKISSLPTPLVNAYGIYQTGTTEKNYFGSKIGIGQTLPTANLHLRAGTTAASSAPIKLASGSLMTAPEAGAVEFLTDDYFVTITTGTARKAFVLDDGTRLTSGRIPFATTNGRLIDDSDLTFATDTLTVTKIIATTSITNSALTSGRVVIAGTAGILADDADFTFATDTLTVTKIATTTMTGTTTHTGSMIVKSVTDAGPMTATNGTVAEIVYNTSNSKFYGCVVTGTPATWSAFN